MEAFTLQFRPVDRHARKMLDGSYPLLYMISDPFDFKIERNIWTIRLAVLFTDKSYLKREEGSKLAVYQVPLLDRICYVRIGVDITRKFTAAVELTIPGSPSDINEITVADFGSPYTLELIRLARSMVNSKYQAEKYQRDELIEFTEQMLS